MNDKYLEILNFINENPELVIIEPSDYANQLTMAFGVKNYPHEVNETIFPKMRLHVERLDPDFVKTNFKLLYKQFTKLTSQTSDTFNDIWITTSNVSDRDLLLVELSFE